LRSNYGRESVANCLTHTGMIYFNHYAGFTPDRESFQMGARRWPQGVLFLLLSVVFFTFAAAIGPIATGNEQVGLYVFGVAVFLWGWVLIGYHQTAVFSKAAGRFELARGWFFIIVRTEGRLDEIQSLELECKAAQPAQVSLPFRSQEESRRLMPPTMRHWLTKTVLWLHCKDKRVLALKNWPAGQTRILQELADWIGCGFKSNG